MKKTHQWNQSSHESWTIRFNQSSTSQSQITQVWLTKNIQIHFFPHFLNITLVFEPVHSHLNNLKHEKYPSNEINHSTNHEPTHFNQSRTSQSQITQVGLTKIIRIHFFPITNFFLSLKPNYMFSTFPHFFI